MFNVPLHPALAHLPLALAMFAPLVAGIAAWVYFRKNSRAAWSVVVATLALTAATGFLSIQTGEGDEEKVENVVSERIIESHEEAATVFVAGAGLAMLVALGAWAAKSGGLRTGLSVATVLVSAVVAGLAIRTGHSGGELVYVHGAAAAHVQAAGISGPALGDAAVRGDEDDDD